MTLVAKVAVVGLGPGLLEVATGALEVVARGLGLCLAEVVGLGVGLVLGLAEVVASAPEVATVGHGLGLVDVAAGALEVIAAS